MINLYTKYLAHSFNSSGFSPALFSTSSDNKGENHPSFGKSRSGDTRELSIISASNPNSLKIEVTDLYLNSKTTYNSIHEAARTLSIPQGRISTYFIRNQKKP
jgi:hypothetical protein